MKNVINSCICETVDSFELIKWCHLIAIRFRFRGLGPETASEYPKPIDERHVSETGSWITLEIWVALGCKLKSLILNVKMSLQLPLGVITLQFCFFIFWISFPWKLTFLILIGTEMSLFLTPKITNHFVTILLGLQYSVNNINNDFLVVRYKITY